MTITNVIAYFRTSRVWSAKQLPWVDSWTPTFMHPFLSTLVTPLTDDCAVSFEKNTTLNNLSCLKPILWKKAYPHPRRTILLTAHSPVWVARGAACLKSVGKLGKLAVGIGHRNYWRKTYGLHKAHFPAWPHF